MKPRFAVISIVIGSLLLIASINNVQAQWAAITGSGYGITTDYHGEEAPLMSTVTAFAGTRDSTVATIDFKWLMPDGSVAHTDWAVAVTGPLTTPDDLPPGAPEEIIDWASKYPGIQYWYACAKYEPSVIGDWAVKAVFHNAFGHTLSSAHDKLPVRATSFMVVPEAALGTVAVLLSMFGAFGVYAVRKKRIF